MLTFGVTLALFLPNMRFSLPASDRSIDTLLRSWGYSPNTQPGKDPNFVRRVRPGQPWPRYHLYLSQQNEAWVAELHVDQKPETRHYNPTHAHNGEYDGPLVENEVKRLQQLL